MSSISGPTKARLKQIQKCIKDQEWQTATDLSKEVLKDEGGKGQGVYNALVFAGVALSKLEKPGEAEKVYLQASSLFPEQALAWQGLSKLYTDTEAFDKLKDLEHDAVRRSYEAGNATELAKHLEKLIEAVRRQENVGDLKKILLALLPSSQLYPVLRDLESVDTSNDDDAKKASSADPSTYVPWQVPEFPSPPPFSMNSPLSTPPPAPASFATKPVTYIPTPFPPIRQIVRDQNTSLALLVTLTLMVEYDQRILEEKEVEKRRKRLDAGSEKEVRRQVGRTVLGASQLPALYDEISSHPMASEELRRAAEGKLFRHWYRLMHCLSRSQAANKVPTTGQSEDTKQTLDLFREVEPSPMPTKDEARAKVEEMIQGMILLKIPNEGGWYTDLEWQDTGGLDAYAIEYLHLYISLFEASPVTSLIQAYLVYFGHPLPDDDPKKKKRRKDTAKLDSGDQIESYPDGPDPLDALVMPKSIFAHKILAEAMLREEDWENLISFAEKGKSLTKTLEAENGSTMLATRALFDVYLGTALVNYYPPKHHERAMALLEGVLQLDESAVSCLMGRAYILQARGDFDAARRDFERSFELDSEGQNVDEALIRSTTSRRAWEESGWCLVQGGDLAAGHSRLTEVAKALEDQPDKSTDAARVDWRLGVAEWRVGDAARDAAHDRFVNCLKLDPTFASGFCSLGEWYADHAQPPDEVRASQCFQKAFELDATQGEAAKRLAASYARDGEWAIVNTIVKRVIEGEGGLEGGLSKDGPRAATTMFVPTNAWAWKALGAVHMFYRKFEEAASAFQVALRVLKQDASIWLRLGEAYMKSGRHVAAIRALNQSVLLSDEHWIAHYHLGTAYRELGLYEKGIHAFRSALNHQPSSVGVKVALASTLFARGRHEEALSLAARASRTYTECLSFLIELLLEGDTKHTVWKLFADCSFRLSFVARAEEDINEAHQVICQAMNILNETATDNTAAGVTNVTHCTEILKEKPTSLAILKGSICAYAWRAHLLRYDTRVVEPQLYDLSAALYRLITLSEANSKQRSSAVRAAVLTIRKALESDPSSPTLWNAFGVVAKEGSAQLAQHAFIVSLELEPRNPVVWCNLGFLYLQLEDPTLAYHLFYRAQTLDPECALAWMGQAMTAELTGNVGKAESLFAQAQLTSQGVLVGAALGLAKHAFELSSWGSIAGTHDELHPISFGLGRFLEKYPERSSARLLYALSLERLSQYSQAQRQALSAVQILEAEYEKTESATTEGQYITALVTLGRLQLADSKPTEAVQTFTDCINLLAERTDDTGVELRGQARLGLALGLALDPEALHLSLEAFEAAIADANMLNGSRLADAIAQAASTALAKSLWSLRDQDAKEAAQSHLLECFSREGRSSSAMSTLAAIGQLNDDMDVVDAVTAEFKSLSPETLLETDPTGLIVKTEAWLALALGDLDLAQAGLQKAIHREPSKATWRQSLAALLLAKRQDGDSETATALLNPASMARTSADELTASLELEALSSVPSTEAAVEGALSRPVTLAQRALMLRPSENRLQAALALTL